MKQALLLLCIFWSAAAGAQKNIPQGATRIRAFDKGWRFLKDSISGAQHPDFPDSSWRRVELPHDWSIENLPGQKPGEVSGPFSRAGAGGTSTGFVVGGTGWYRKHFILKENEAHKIVSIYFEGVYMNADVWINGHHLGNHPYGYTPFVYDLTKWLNKAGQENILAVQVKNYGRNSRWYSGSGIYRHVWLTLTERVHVDQWGVFITTPRVSPAGAALHIETTIINENDKAGTVLLRTQLLDPEGKVVKVISGNILLKPSAATRTIRQCELAFPALWSVETPWLYKAVTEIIVGHKITDSVINTFGIRDIRVSATNGLTINGKTIKLKGGSIHNDNGPLGSAAIDRAEERKIELLKKNGFNALRTSHNPPSRSLLDACDRLGMMVIDEAFDMWERPKNPDDYHLYFDRWWKQDLTSFILRDRNHPSVIFWSIGNEINERGDSVGLAIARRLIATVRVLDQSRPVTEAICAFWEHPGRTWDSTVTAFSLLDAGGYNYEWKHYASDHLKYPNRIMIGTESFAREAWDNWQQVEQHPYVMGDFVWTAMDYMGEAAIGHALAAGQQDAPSLGWPWFNAWCGDIDLIGNKKPQSYYRDVVWGRSKIEMAVHKPMPNLPGEIVSNWGWMDEQQSWTWRGAEGKPLQVRVFSRASLVRLYLNNMVTGEKKISDTSKGIAVFEVAYEPGILKAVVVEDGRETDSVVFRTAMRAVRIRLSADRAIINADRNDLSYVTAEILDREGTVVPDKEVAIRFSVSGAGGELAAVGNANPVDMSSFQDGIKNTFRGKCLAIIRPGESPSTILLKASAEGLEDAEITIETK